MYITNGRNVVEIIMNKVGGKIMTLANLSSSHGEVLVDALNEISRNNALVSEIATHALDELNLLFWRQAGDGGLEYRAHADLVNRDEGVVVHVSEEAHDELAVHTISDTAVSGNRVAKVLDLECSLESGSEEPSEGSDE